VTRVVGKAPIDLTFTPKVSIAYPDRILVETGGFLQGNFKARGELSPSCAAALVVALRTALREIRMERIKHFERQVLEAEKDLP
jgi:hypothetical protein